MNIEMEMLQKAAEVLKTVAHPSRLGIIDLLEQGERAVNEISHSLKIPQPYTSQQLNLMKAKGILGSRRSGIQVYYFIANPSVVEIIHCVRRHAQGSDDEAAPASGACPASS